MKNFNFKSIAPHIVAVVLFLVISLTYFSSLLEGKRIQQSDMMHYYGMSKEITDYRAETGKEALWTNAMFGGMPAYLISTIYTSNLLRYANIGMNLGLNKPANYLFLTLLGFYILMLVLGVNPWLAMAGAIAYSFSTYFFLIESAGHNTKSLSIAYMAPIIAGVLLSLKNKKPFMGAGLFGLFLGFQLLANHLQITYYTALIVLILGIYFFIDAIKEKAILQFTKSVSILVFVAILAVGTSITNMWLVWEYSSESMRGQSELSDTKNNKTSGLDKDYATSWSYGKAETWTLLVPNFMGGSSTGELDKKSETYKVLEENNVPNPDQIVKQLPLYWGAQPFTGGPTYIGAIVIFLFVLGLILVRGKMKWWLLTITIVSILLAWGRNFMWLTDLFLDYFPMYNKFRTPSMILVIAQFSMPLLGILALKQIVEEKISKEEILKKLKIAGGIVLGILLIFALLPGMFFDFVSPNDAKYVSNGYPQWLIDSIVVDRASLLKSDAFRSLVLVALSIGAILLMMYQKISKNVFYVILIALFLIDLWPVNKRYLNDENFVSKQEERTPFPKTPVDEYILKDTDPNFRVFNVATDPFNDAGTSYYHKTIGGYHAAKMKRYQELIERHISKNNMAVLNMLNTKYFIVKTEQGVMPQRNVAALGNAWFVKNIKLVENADSEITALTNFKPQEIAIIDKRFAKVVSNLPQTFDSTSTIKLTSYKPNHLIYKSESKTEQLAVFSEIYYNKGWDAYIDGKPANYVRANYVLRAMKVPAGSHTIEYKFEPKGFFIGEKISLISSSLILLIFVGAFGFEIFKKKTEEDEK